MALRRRILPLTPLVWACAPHHDEPAPQKKSAMKVELKAPRVTRASAAAHHDIDPCTGEYLRTMGSWDEW